MGRGTGFRFARPNVKSERLGSCAEMNLLTRILPCGLTLTALASFSFADEPAVIRTSDHSVTIPRVDQPPAIEDFLTMDPSPRMAGKMARVEGFRQWIPHDGQPVSQRTVAYLAFDSKNFYAVFICFDNEPNQIRAHLGHRDDIWDDDFVDIWIDSFHDHRRAYEFVVNPLGLQGDGLATDSNEDFSFDTLWYSRGQITKQGWVAWFAIPFKSLRFPKARVPTCVTPVFRALTPAPLNSTAAWIQSSSSRTAWSWTRPLSPTSVRLSRTSHRSPSVSASKFSFRKSAPSFSRTRITSTRLSTF